jgi:protein-disulfide isomerase
LENHYRQKTLEVQHQAIDDSIKEIINNFKAGDIKTFSGKFDAPIKIIEFFDYSCGFCAQMLETNSKILQENSDISIIYIELPMLGAESIEATRFATAISMVDQSKYLQFQIQLFNSKLSKNRDTMMQIAANVGIDVLALQKFIDNRDNMDKIEEKIKKNSLIFNNMKLQGTPTYIIGDEVLVGAVSVEKINTSIAAERNKEKK